MLGFSMLWTISFSSIEARFVEVHPETALNCVIICATPSDPYHCGIYSTENGQKR